jgi:hypothetical protein
MRRPLIAAATAVALATTAPTANAEDPTITAQARIANAEFLAFAPPPESGPGAVCLVDTGVDLNPDTEPNVIERIALDDGDPGDVYHSKHGTRMAMVMGGAVNGWGSVGIWPHVRIVSVRAMPPGESAFPFNLYKRAVVRCRQRLGAGLPITSINLSLGGANATDQEIAELQDVVAGARIDGLNVVGAAGNDGAAVEYPAAIGEAFAVGAIDDAGAFCSFSSRGAGLDIAAPGCRIDVSLADGALASGNGTSDSSAIVAAVLTALRSYRPDLEPQESEALLLSTARSTGAGPALDVEAAFRAAGLADVVEAGNAAVPQAPPPPAGGAGGLDAGRSRPSIGAGREGLPRPRLRRATLTRDRLTLALANRPDEAVVRVRIVYGASRGEFRRRERTLDRVASRFRLRVPHSWSRVELEYRHFEREASDSLALSRRSVNARSRSNTRPGH